ncbi:CHAD domain-containing protein [Roseomonas sp. SSH11]|uniref:CHAD domain-containing protein n=1 Tax=Pararoseomonas baculiformis TaxID=2820812 RepID=A0ABS4AE81_9PROT|nr:CHAD domain-containing protein [Pararoseomonas baculiformis]MBP0445320.1 CHAD domain-containing protein [Pararoseomonas baculiformis]
MNHTTEPPPKELEIKFQLPDGCEAALASHPALASCEAHSSRREVTTYFDTPDHRLADAGASLRVRQSEGRHVQTLKLRDGAGPFGRAEWEWPLPGEEPDPARLAQTPLASLANDGTRLIALFTAEVTRSIRTLRQDGTLVEVTTDLGAIRAGEAQEPIREMELELKEGDPAALYRLASAIQAETPLLLGTEAKSDRGWRLLTGQPREVEKQDDLDFPPDITAGEAFRNITGATLASLLANQPAAAAGVMEGIHQMRVAIRRLRACLALFRPCLDEEREEAFTGQLRQLGRCLGAARDWDVFCAETLPHLAGRGLPEPLLGRLLAAAETERAAAHESLSAEFARPALTRTVLGLAAWAEDPVALSGQPDGGDMAEPLADLAPELEERLARRVLRRGRRIRHRTDEELHDLRKSLKRLRYGVEFLAPLHRRKRVSAYLRRCKDLQEELGALNDGAMAVTLAEQLAARDKALEPAVHSLQAWAGHRRAEALERLPKAWRGFRHAALPRVSAG